MRLTEQTDHELMLAVHDGDVDAFETLMNRHEQSAFRFAFRIVKRRDDASDVVQDVFLKLWEQPDSWKPDAKFSTWLYRVVTNRSLNIIRNRKFKSFISFSDPEKNVEPEISQADHPDRQQIVSEETAQFELELNLLPPRQRAALHLHYREELPVAEVAKSLGVSLKSAESLIFRGKRTLRERLR